MLPNLLTYLLALKERGFLDASLRCAVLAVLPSLHVRLTSPNALWRRSSILSTRVVVERRGSYLTIFVIPAQIGQDG